MWGPGGEGGPRLAVDKVQVVVRVGAGGSLALKVRAVHAILAVLIHLDALLVVEMVVK